MADDPSLLARVQHYFAVTDPRTLFASEAAVVEARLLAASGPGSVSGADVEAARSLLASVTHPETGDVIPLGGRMSSQVIVSLVLCAGMLRSTGVAGTVFWQAATQTYNVALNYYNRSASSSVTDDQLAKMYVAAVVGSVSVALGMRSVARRLTMLPPTAYSIVNRVTPVFGVSAAHFINTSAIRGSEITEGITVYAPDGSPAGTSCLAGRTAVGQTIATRIGLAIPTLVLPPIISVWTDKTRVMQANPRARLPLELAVICGLIWVTLPVALGAYPQTVRADPEQLEPEFRGRGLEYVTFSKGL